MLGTLVVYGVFHPNKTMFSKCWASPIQLYTVMDWFCHGFCLATDKNVCLQPWGSVERKVGGDAFKSSGSGLRPAALWTHPADRGVKAHAKTHLSALKWRAKGQLGIQFLQHTPEWVFLSSCVLSEAAGEQWCVLVCAQVQLTRHRSTTTRSEVAEGCLWAGCMSAQKACDQCFIQITRKEPETCKL